MTSRKLWAVLCLATFQYALSAEKTERVKRSLEYISEGQDQCATSDETMDFCVQCAKLPGLIATPLEKCCADPSVLLGCQACIFNIRQCVSEAFAGGTSENALPNYSSEEDGINEESMEKRFGRLFMSRPGKRYGKLFVGKRNYLDDEDMELAKRWGRLFTSKWGRKRGWRYPPYEWRKDFE